MFFNRNYQSIRNLIYLQRIQIHHLILQYIDIYGY